MAPNTNRFDHEIQLPSTDYIATCNDISIVQKLCEMVNMVPQIVQFHHPLGRYIVYISSMLNEHFPRPLSHWPGISGYDLKHGKPQQAANLKGQEQLRALANCQVIRRSEVNMCVPLSHGCLAS